MKLYSRVFWAVVVNFLIVYFASGQLSNDDLGIMKMFLNIIVSVVVVIVSALFLFISNTFVLKQRLKDFLTIIVLTFLLGTAASGEMAARAASELYLAKLEHDAWPLWR